MSYMKQRGFSCSDELWEDYEEYLSDKPESRSARIRQLMQADIDGRIEIT